ncbi:7-cyano-7-deazaguanine/7-aminomethyl-7-deazaguanine transporter [Eikenella sp. S3360]|uniref:Probable queuosine precursor transporter n=1 Tax=Eikenella glucosivorans TaxID=2766967 RepID=A0ABS0NDE7_9NEIS|nr:7-cyano-7-deazaguanine/7-aminomethyl-7-deazaguanine transporter [Eikenella glucosivorans]MBH5330318.1 7-cyano-7-deazaguanine/7-aminomethyl-7-deazaguanine transporter [Eikenella glucosivorans]
MQNYVFTPAQQRQALIWLTLFHILVIAASNYLVQFPFTVTLPNGFEVHSTWGALTFPFIFLATDLTVRIFGQRLARRIIFLVMFPSLLVSYAFSVLFQEGAWTGWSALAVFVMPVFRIALASFSAYAVGQILDIFVFNRLRQLKSWWIAPTASTFAGNAVDTLLFFSIAFAASADAFMAANWPHIAFVDYLFKLVICTLFFLPAYGLILNILTRKLTTLHQPLEIEAAAPQPETASQSN